MNSDLHKGIRGLIRMVMVCAVGVWSVCRLRLQRWQTIQTVQLRTVIFLYGAYIHGKFLVWY